MEPYSWPQNVAKMFFAAFILPKRPEFSFEQPVARSHPSFLINQIPNALLNACGILFPKIAASNSLKQNNNQWVFSEQSGLSKFLPIDSIYRI